MTLLLPDYEPLPQANGNHLSSAACLGKFGYLRRISRIRLGSSAVRRSHYPREDLSLPTRRGRFISILFFAVV